MALLCEAITYFSFQSCFIIFLQVDEQERINRFRYRLDAKASLIGRLLMRFWAMKTFQIENDAIIFDRSDRGRPRLLLNDEKSWIFNVSHAGDYTVFTGVYNKMKSRIIKWCAIEFLHLLHKPY